jgi:hypothetical protein
MSEPEAPEYELEGFSHKRDAFEVWLAIGLLAMSFAGLLTAISTQATSIASRVAIVAYAITVPYWGSLVVTFEFQREHGLREVPGITGSCLGAFFILITFIGTGALVVHAWLPAGVIFTLSCVASWLASFRYYQGRKGKNEGANS